MAAGPIAERNHDATIYVGGLDEKVTEALLWELFIQAGPVISVRMPRDPVTQLHQGYGFLEFMTEEDANYAIKIMNMIKLYGNPIRVNKTLAHQKNFDVGANIFIGNLDPEVNEKLLYDTFSAFGVILQTPKVMRDPDTGESKGFGFINFASFEAADSAMDALNGQYLCNRPISVSYAFKKDTKGERHGTAAERLLAAQNPHCHAGRPHQLFADAPVRRIIPFMGPILPPHFMMPTRSGMMPGPLPIPAPSLPGRGFPSSIPPPPLPPMLTRQLSLLSPRMLPPPPWQTRYGLGMAPIPTAPRVPPPNWGPLPPGFRRAPFPPRSMPPPPFNGAKGFKY